MPPRLNQSIRAYFQTATNTQVRQKFSCLKAQWHETAKLNTDCIRLYADVAEETFQRQFALHPLKLNWQ